jgi:multicomponent Na+:H+ antiporter subunit E
MMLVNVLLAIAWSALTGKFGVVDLGFGFALGFGILWIAAGRGSGAAYFRGVPRTVGFVLYALWELLLANLKVARLVLTPRIRLRPGIVAVPLDLRTDAEITTLANLITLTPGTLSLDVSHDRRVLYVHAIEVVDPEEFRRETKRGFERAVAEVFE